MFKVRDLSEMTQSSSLLMSFLSLQLLTILALIAATSAYYIPSSYHHNVVYYYVPHIPEPKAEMTTETSTDEAQTEETEKDEPANYDFKYEVNDEKTGDIKSHSESSSNGVVKGQYSLIDSDGFKRIVEYTADDVHGFQATVMREPTDIKIPQPDKKPEEPKTDSHAHHYRWW